MQSSTVERIRSQRVKSEGPITNSKRDKLTRKHRRLHRAIKQGEYRKSDVSDNNQERI